MSEPSKLRIHRLNREDLFPSFASLPAKRERANVVSETGDIQLALVSWRSSNSNSSKTPMSRGALAGSSWSSWQAGQRL